MQIAINENIVIIITFNINICCGITHCFNGARLPKRI